MDMDMDTLSRKPDETERVLRLYEREAHKYDRQMRFFDRLVGLGARTFADGRLAFA